MKYKYINIYIYIQYIYIYIYICIWAHGLPQSHCGDNREGTLFSR